MFFFTNLKGGVLVKKWTTKMLVEAGVMLALALVLDRIKIYRMPLGGSVTAGSMIPIIIFSMRWGLGPGIIAGVTYGVLKLILGGYILNPIQAILEYPLAFGCLGLSGVFSDSLTKIKEINYPKIIASVFIAISGRFICHLIAGVVFFSSDLPEGVNAWANSAIYQGSYLVPEFIIGAVLLSLLWKPLSKIEK